MDMFKSWKFWAFALAAATANVIVASLLGWPFVAGAWAGIYAATNEHLFVVRK